MNITYAEPEQSLDNPQEYSIVMDCTEPMQRENMKFISIPSNIEVPSRLEIAVDGLREASKLAENYGKILIKQNETEKELDIPNKPHSITYPIDPQKDKTLENIRKIEKNHISINKELSALDKEFISFTDEYAKSRQEFYKYEKMESRLRSIANIKDPDKRKQELKRFERENNIKLYNAPTEIIVLREKAEAIRKKVESVKERIESLESSKIQNLIFYS